jgi:hypothetical protein
MKFYLLYLSCDDFFNLCIRIFTVLNAFGNFSPAEYAQTLTPWHRIRNKSSLGIHEHCSMKKPSASKEKTLTVWYSHQCTLASHHSRCTLIANKIDPLVPCKSIRIHFHHFRSSRPLLPEKPPRSWRTRGNSHSGRTASNQRSEPFESNLFFSTLSLDFDCNLTIHLSLISASTCY